MMSRTRKRSTRRCYAACESLENRRLLTTFTVSNENDTGAGSLRQAIWDANANSGADVISFNISAGGAVKTIAPLSELPSITGTLIIDGYTQPSASPNTSPSGSNAVIRIRLSGINTTGNVTGLSFTAGSGSSVKGLSIGSWYTGVRVGTTNTSVVGNFIGLEPDGTSAFPNSFGVFVSGGTNNNVGSAAASDRNVISGNATSQLQVGTSGTPTDVSGFAITGNYIGTDASGLSDATSGTARGIVVVQGSSGTIGGSGSGQGNVVAGNGGDGILLTGSVFDSILGNKIGVSVSGSPLSNGGNGITLGGFSGSAAACAIGGRAVGEGNVIANNGLRGVSVGGSAADPSGGNQIVGNSIYDNAALGIDLAVDANTIGVTPNDDGDFDSGPNGYQNFPVLASATALGAIGGTLSSRQGATYTLDFYASPSPDPSGAGEGKTYLGMQSVRTASNGTVNFTYNAPAIALGSWVTATATDSNGNTSEFAADLFLPFPYLVTSTADSGVGSLRQAMINANAVPSVKTISFQIPTSSPGYANGVFKIMPTSALPAITATTVIDGASQTAFSGDTNPFGPEIEIDGALAGGVDGVVFSSSTANSSACRSVAVVRFAGAGIRLFGVSNCVVEGSYLGIDPTGVMALPNGGGIVLNGSGNGNTIGGLSVASRNLISGNVSDGIQITNPNNSNSLEGNFIGTDRTGTAKVANLGYGLRVTASSGNSIGGTTAGAGNLFSGNALDGIVFFGGNSNVVQGNFVGVNASGSAALGNAFKGIGLFNGAQGTRIGGSTPAARNVISGNPDAGISINDTSGATVIGNYIGTNAAGTAPIGNGLDGIELVAPANNNQIGGVNAGEGNLISGNRNGIGITSNGNIVQGNLIGTNAAGTAALSNVQAGISIYNAAQSNTIGGASGGARNVISGNGTQGILFSSDGTSLNIVRGNYIGTNATGTGQLGNNAEGIKASGGSNLGPTFNTMGGFQAGELNVIAFNTGAGVWIERGLGNAIRGNSIHDNGQLGIDLGAAGITANDSQDVDGGANALLNTPTLDAIGYLAAFDEYFVTGALNSTPNKTFTIDLYTSPTADPSGRGEGATYLSSISCQTDAQGNGSFTQYFPAAPQYLTATTNGAQEGTSEFSLGIGAPGLQASPGADFSFARNSDGSQTLTISSGTVTFNADAAQNNPGLIIHVVTLGRSGGGGNVVFNANQHLTSLQIDSGAGASVATNGNILLNTATLSITGSGRLDLNDNDLLVTGTAKSTVETYVRTAYNFGGWDGIGGIFSSTAKDNPSGNTTLGLLSGQEFMDNNGGLFDGAAVSSSSALVKYTYFGDVDFNGAVDSTDYNLIDFGFLTHATGWANGDVDYSGSSPDSSDYNLIDYAFVSQHGNL